MPGTDQPNLLLPGKRSLTPAQVMLRLFMTCWLIYALHFATNTVREIYPALSLGDHLSFDVREYLGLHPDIFDLPGRGVFINNNPGASILGAVPYAIFRPITDRIVERILLARQASGAQPPEYESVYPMAREFYKEAFRRGLDVKFGLGAGVMQAFLMAPLAALSVAVMYWLLLRLTGSAGKSLALALLYAFATPVFYRVAQLNHNLLLALFAFFAFLLLWQPQAGGGSRAPSAAAYGLAGLLTGWTLVFDYTGIVTVICLGGYALAVWLQTSAGERRFSGLAWFGLGLAAGVAVLLGYQWLAFGNPIYPAQRYMPETQYSGFGYRGMTLPQPDLFFETGFNIRYGLFAASPLLLLALYIPAWLRRDLRLLPNRETVFVLLLSLGLFLFTAANQFARLQFNSGVRHVVPAVPFLFLLAAGVLLRLPRWTAWIIGAVATYWSWSLAMYRDVELGLGVFEALIHITTEGPRLPWMATLQNLGMLPGWVSPAWLLLAAGVVIAALWLVPFPALPGARLKIERLAQR